MGIASVLRTIGIALAIAGGLSTAQAQNYDRIVTPEDITIAAAPGGGWTLVARVWLANETPSALDMGCVLTLTLNGVTLTSTSQAVVVPGSAGATNGCASSCVPDVACAACRPSIIVPGSCYCCNHSVSVEFVVPSLAPGDVLAAYAVPLPGSVDEIATGNDGAVAVVPIPGGHNRAVKPSGVHYGRTASGAYALAGEVDLRTVLDGTDRDLSYEIGVLVNGVPWVSGGGTCTGTTRLISISAGQMIGTTPPQFLCEEACLYCSFNIIGGTGTPTGNICIPPSGSGPSSNPWCQCHDACNVARIVPGLGWQVEVPQLSPADIVTVVVNPHPVGLPENDTSDDAVAVYVAQAALCGAVFADVGRQGGEPGGDGLYDNNDFIVFIGYFFDANPRADVGGQGGVAGPDGRFDNNDFIVFIDLFFTPCA